MWLETASIMSQSLGVGNSRCSLAGSSGSGSLTGCSQGVSHGGSLLKAQLGKDLPPGSQCDCWQDLEVTLSSLSPGAPHRTAYDMVALFPPSEQVRRIRVRAQRKSVFCHLISQARSHHLCSDPSVISISQVHPALTGWGACQGVGGCGSHRRRRLLR